MIATYPNFTKLTLDLKSEITDFTARFAPYSDFNFTSLFCWDVDQSIELSYLNENLVVRMPDYLDGHLVYSLLGDTMIDATIAELLTEVEKLEMVPEVVIDAMHENDIYIVKPDEDNFDYVYNLAHLSELTGGNFKKKRNKKNVFVNDHSDLELIIKATDTLDTEQIERLKAIDLEWAKMTSRDEGDIVPERTALAKLLDNFEHFNAYVTEIFVDGEIKAFSINEVIDDQYAICHFEKALKAHHEHIYAFLAVEVARDLHKRGCKLVNWEQDLGLPGLRRSKLSYHPELMLKKYTIALRRGQSAI